MQKSSATRIALAVSTLLLAGAGCGSAAGRAASWDPVPARMQSAVRVLVSAPAGVAPVMTATLADAGSERRVPADGFRRTELQPSPHTAWYPAAESGTMEVRVEVRGAPGESLGTGTVSLPLGDGWLWSVEALIYRPAAGVPAPPCFNCHVVARVPLRASPAVGVAAGDSLFLRAARAPAAGRPPLPPS
ncbi:MAG TPA: hypothetical protein VHG93_26055 [Longimicrobium sp.]|nr:hypothetical protein [Longimicrobium sp.]